MRMTGEELNLRVVVRRVAMGLRPYGWEVHGDALEPLHASPGRFRGMEAACKAGHAWLAEYISSRRTPVLKRPRSRRGKVGFRIGIKPQLQAHQEGNLALGQQPVEPPNNGETGGPYGASSAAKATPDHMPLLPQAPLPKQRFVA